MVDDVLHPPEVRVAGRRDPVLPADVVTELRLTPVTHVERRIGQDEIGLEVRVEVAME